MGVPYLESHRLQSRCWSGCIPFQKLWDVPAPPPLSFWVQFLVVVRCRIWFPCWLLAAGCYQLLAVGQLLSCVWLFVTPWAAAPQTFLPSTISWSLLQLMSIESRMPSNHLILCIPLLLPTSIFPSIRVFSSEPALPIRWPKYWSCSFSISPSNKYSGLISFRAEWALKAIKMTVVCVLGGKGRLWKFLSRGLAWSASSIK